MPLHVTISVVCNDESEAAAVKSQLQMVARPMYSNPPVHGALLVSTILEDPLLKAQWHKEVKVQTIFFCATNLQFNVHKFIPVHG